MDGGVPGHCPDEHGNHLCGGNPLHPFRDPDPQQFQPLTQCPRRHVTEGEARGPAGSSDSEDRTGFEKTMNSSQARKDSSPECRFVSPSILWNDLTELIQLFDQLEFRHLGQREDTILSRCLERLPALR